MKRTLLITSIFCAFLFVQCHTEKKVVYDIPANYPEANKKELLAELDKGKELYKTHCSDCHGIFTKGKDKIPNFTNTQLDNYTSKFVRRDPKNHAVVMNMSPMDFNQIINFLHYRKKPDPANVTTPKPMGRG